MIGEFGLKLNIASMPSERNKTNVLTRVKMAWLGKPEELKQGIALACGLNNSELMRIHAMRHWAWIGPCVSPERLMPTLLDRASKWWLGIVIQSN